VISKIDDEEPEILANLSIDRVEEERWKNFSL